MGGWGVRMAAGKSMATDAHAKFVFLWFDFLCSLPVSEIGDPPFLI